MPKNLFVTGATGRLGQRFVHAAVKKGYAVTALVRDPTKASVLPRKVELFKGDLNRISREVLQEGVREKTVVHLAAVVNYWMSAEKLWDINVEGTRKIVEAAEAENVGRFVHMSSAGIYHKPIYLPIDEKQPPTPMAGYGVTKLEAEKIVEKSELDYVMIRAPAIYGPGFDEGFREVIEWVRKGKMPIIGSGKNRVPFIHVDDVVHALMLAAENRGIHREAFIVTSGEEYTQEQALKMVAKVLNVKVPMRRVPIPVAYGMVGIDALLGLFTGKRRLRKLYVDFLAEDRVFDISKARQLLGFKPTVSLEEGLRGLLR